MKPSAAPGPAPLRDAAAIVPWVDGPEPRVVWVRRSAGAPFAGGFHAFAGGKPDPTDAAAACTGGADSALRVAGLRELFEETGLLAAVGASALARPALHALRQAYARSAAEGAARFAALGLAWRTSELEPVGRWLTPDLSAVRFDTRFFALRLDGPPGELEPDRHEVDTCELVSAREGLGRFARGEALLAPPVTTLLRVLEERGRFDARAMREAPGADGRPSLRFEVVPAIQIVPLRTPTLPPATHTNAYLVGSREAVLVEPASPWQDGIERALAWVRENEALGVTVRALVLTHHHVDHAGGAAALKERLRVPLWAHAETAARLEGEVQVDRLLADGERIELEGPIPVALRAVHTPGHAPGHLCFLEERSGALLAGDMVASEGTILVEPGDGDMALYLDSLRRLAALSPSQLLPAHGMPILDPQAKLAHYLEHRLAREAKVLEALRAAGEGARPEDLVPLAYADAPREVWPLAALSTAAHLHKLAAEGRARVEGGRWSPAPARARAP